MATLGSGSDAAAGSGSHGLLLTAGDNQSIVVEGSAINIDVGELSAVWVAKAWKVTLLRVSNSMLVISCTGIAPTTVNYTCRLLGRVNAAAWFW